MIRVPHFNLPGPKLLDLYVGREYLRVFSPSAEVRGHGPGQEVLQAGKREVNIREIEPIGVYAVKLAFSDGHDTGIYSWDYLYDLGVKQDSNWKSYLARLEQAGKSRDSSGNGNQTSGRDSSGNGKT